jgi:drug/metabolite transporter (DMT)-like permease
MIRQKPFSVLCAVFAAVFYGINIPVAKILLEDMPPVFMASLLYLGAGIGAMALNFFHNKQTREKEARLTKLEMPYTTAMVVLDIAAPILLMIGLSMINPATASLLGNFEIVATTAVALVVFKEAVGKRMYIAITLIIISSVILSVEDFGSLKFSPGSIFVLLACVCWGFENNCTRMLSLKDPMQIVVIKGIASGLGSFLIAFFTGAVSAKIAYIGLSLLLGFVSYGLSIYLYILAQRNLGAVRTSTFYAFAPFIGSGLSFVIFRDTPSLTFLTAFVVMTIGAYLAAFEKHDHEHTHNFIEHEHSHNHNDGHHDHQHETPVTGEHSHVHIHEPRTHKHRHTPDLHHSHTH